MTARKQLDEFIAKYTPEMAAEGKAALSIMTRLLPSATRMVYDNYNGLVVGFSPTERPSDAVVSLLFMPRWITLCFLQNGPELPDPQRVLRGSGNVVRHIRLTGADDLNTPVIRALLKAAIAQADLPFPRGGKGKLVIRSISAKQRTRVPGARKVRKALM